MHVLTIEGLGGGQSLHPVQAAFIEHDAFQCGYCTPGQIMSAVGLIMEGHAGADPERIREGMGGNLCRCGAYNGIVKAVLAAQSQMQTQDKAEKPHEPLRLHPSREPRRCNRSSRPGPFGLPRRRHQSP